MSAFKFDYDGNEIQFSENEEVWRCWDLNMEDKSLSKLKEKINKFRRDTRNAGVKRVEVYRLGSWRGGMVTLISLASEESAWITTRIGRTDRREKVGLHELIFPTPENMAVLAAAKDLDDQAQELTRKADAARAAIQRVTASALRALNVKGDDTDVA